MFRAEFYLDHAKSKLAATICRYFFFVPMLDVAPLCRSWDAPCSDRHTLQLPDASYPQERIRTMTRRSRRHTHKQTRPRTPRTLT
jgi:hypothetical protein